jgi:two-component system, sensor histidine kinase
MESPREPRAESSAVDPVRLERAVADRTLESIFRHARATMLAVAVLSALLVADAWSSRPWSTLVTWWLVGLAVAGGRWWQARRFLGLPAPAREADVSGWERRLVTGVAATSAFWAAGLLVLAGAEGGRSLSFLGFVMAGVIGVGLASLAGSAGAFAVMVGPVLAAWEVVLVREARTGHDWTMVAAAPVYALTLVAASARLAGRVRSGLRLRLEQADLVEQLAAARDSALAAAQARSEFLAVMSHEIRTPLAGVVGMNALLLGTSLDAEQHDYVRGVQQSAEALLVLLNDVLDVSKIDAGRIELEARDFALKDELETLTRLMRFKAIEKGLALELEADASVPALARGDWPRLRQVLVNLVSNALKFTAAGSVRMVLRARPAPGGGCALAVEVRDTGIGLNPEQRARLFQPFSQGDVSTSRRFGGTGLGLYISRRLVELMGGTIEVESAAGQGSAFRFTAHLEAPLGAVEADADAAAPRRAIVAEVLVVEDNEVNLLVARRLLEREGHRVSAARTGLEALQTLSQGRFDLVLMDLQMPELDGLSATRRLRTDASGPNQQVPVIALTANASAADQRACLDAGFSDYLTKPVAPEALAAAVQRWAIRPPLTPVPRA